MCDRTKAEVLARELVYMYYLGISEDSPTMITVGSFVENNWKAYEEQARSILEELSRHDD